MGSHGSFAQPDGIGKLLVALPRTDEFMGVFYSCGGSVHLRMGAILHKSDGPGGSSSRYFHPDRLPCSCPLENISSGLQGKSAEERSTKNEVQALYFECDAKDVPVVMPFLERIYSSTGVGTYLLGTKFRLILVIDKVMIPRTRIKVERLGNCQAGFDKNIILIIKWEISDLYTVSKHDGTSLHQKIMALKL